MLRTSLLRASAATTRSFSTTSTLARVPKSLNANSARAAITPAARGISSTPPTLEVTEPSHAATQSDIVHEYPEPHEWDEKDLGHSTDGPDVDVGRHQRRTLASFSMHNKVCVVTGAARGLGNLFARTFAESGSNAVVILDLDQTQAETAAKDLEDWFVEHGQAKAGEISALGLGCDVGNEEDVQRCFKTVVEKYGRVDVLVTAAGIVENFAAQDYPSEKIRKLLNINIEGTYFCAREAAKDMMARGEAGSIVLIGSMSGSRVNIPQPQAPYNASKAAVRHLGASLAVEWAQKNIRVNTIAPGYMATALTRVILDRDPALKETWENLTPMGRIGEPEDLKGALIYLASDASVFTTGTELLVDGGYTLT
ncbi:D-arabinitol dehydrogenase [Pseudohyphozyma bogoriensis]|nr:D-arabinitol dehydrogenase [Pseudohyphozyma bogoriensis]